MAPEEKVLRWFSPTPPFCEAIEIIILSFAGSLVSVSASGFYGCEMPK
jgi:hypothetical protein